MVDGPKLTPSEVFAIVLDVLETLEWDVPEPDSFRRECSLCSRYEQFGHKEDCELSYAIAQVKEQLKCQK